LADRVLTLEDAEEVAPLPVFAAAASTNGDGDTAGDSPPVARPSGALHVRVDAGQLGEEGLHRLKEMLGRRHGDLPVLLHVRASDREVVMDARELRVAASAELQAELETLLGAGAVWQD
jgi:hypothetical protein